MTEGLISFMTQITEGQISFKTLMWQRNKYHLWHSNVRGANLLYDLNDTLVNVIFDSNDGANFTYDSNDGQISFMSVMTEGQMSFMNLMTAGGISVMTNGRGANNLYDSNDKRAIYDSNDRWANLKLCFSQEWTIHWFRHSLWVESLDSLWVSDGYWINPSCQCGFLTQTLNHHQLPSTWRTQQHTNTKTAGVYNTFKHLNYSTEVELLLINYTATRRLQLTSQTRDTPRLILYI